MNTHNWIASCFNRSVRGKKASGSGRRGTACNRRARLGFELLETRLAPAALATPQLTLLDPTNFQNDQFGFSVAVSGSDVLVGANNYSGGEGIAYLYQTSGQLLQTIQDPHPASGDNFGVSVALSGSNVLVGASGVAGGEGVAYLFSTSGGSPLQTFLDPNPFNDDGDGFGFSVAVSGSNVLVGASGTDNGKGAAYLFSTSGGPPLQTFLEPTRSAGDLFGYSVALSSTNVLVGAYANNNYTGAAYLFNTSGQLIQDYTDPNAAAGDFFGDPVAFSGSNVLVGAIGTDDDTGAVYLFSPSSPTPLQTFQDPNNSVGDYFGWTVAVSGNSVLVGAPGVDPYTFILGSNLGAAYEFSTGGKLLQTFQDPNSSTQDFFGFSVAMSGNNVLVGTVGFDGLSGAAYLYEAATSLGALDGNNQSTVMGTPFGTALEVQVADVYGNPVSGASVTFAESNGAGGAGASFAGDTTVITNNQGLAFAPVLTADDTAGSFTVTATLKDLSASFLLTNISGAPASISAAGSASLNTPVGSAFGTLLQALVTDSDSNPVANVPVTFAVPAFGATGTFNALTTVVTNALGIATAPALTANHEPGTFTVTATAAGVADPADFALTNTTIPAAIKAVAATPQSTTVNTAFGSPLKVLVTDANGKPVSGITVDFETPGTGASGAFLFTNSEVVVTNASGVATAPALMANTTAGVWTVDAWVAGVATPAAFTVTNLAGAPSTVKIHGGDNQSATVGKAFATPLQALVVDAYGNPVSGASVTFTAGTSSTLPGGKFAGGKTTAVATTGANGVAKAPALTANTVAGSFSVEAELTSNPSVNTEFSFTNKADPPNERIIGQPESGTVGQDYAQPLSVRVTDDYGNAIVGAALTFTAPASGPSGTFSGSRTATVITGANGMAVAPTFTANTKAGTFLVALSIPGVRSQTMKLTNLPGPAAVVRAVAGTTRTTTINGTVRTLEVQVADVFGNVVQGVPVTFTVQPNDTTGAAGTFSGNQMTVTVTTSVRGNAVAPVLKANDKRGTFTVSASILGGTADELLTLTNR